MFDFFIMLVAIVLIWGILVYWSRTKQQKEPGGLEYARASDVYNKLTTNDNNRFKLMTDFTEPVKLFGPDGFESENAFETTSLTLIDSLGI